MPNLAGQTFFFFNGDAMITWPSGAKSSWFMQHLWFKANTNDVDIPARCDLNIQPDENDFELPLRIVCLFCCRKKQLDSNKRTMYILARCRAWIYLSCWCWWRATWHWLHLRTILSTTAMGRDFVVCYWKNSTLVECSLYSTGTFSASRWVFASRPTPSSFEG